MGEVLVIGHRNPDTDAICSAIAYADFKRRTGMAQVVAARCGETNDRIDFVLRTFGVPPPLFVPDVFPRVRDVMQTNVVSVSPRTSVVEALAVMDHRNIRVLPVLDQERRCLGLLSVFKASKFFFPSPDRVFDSRRVLAPIRSLARILQGKMICGFEPDREEDMILMVATLKPASFAARLPNYPPEKLMVLVSDREDIQALAIRGRVRVLVVTGGVDVSPEICELARTHEVSLILSPHDSATTAMLCRSAIAVRHLLREDFLTLRDEERLADVQRVAVESQFPAFPVLDEDRRVIGILTKSSFLQKVDRQVILVDHNELAQAVPGVEQLEILEILDHHRIGALSTQQPILFRNEPVGSTCTLVAEGYRGQAVELTPSMAGLLLAGVVTDTLNLNSPTTTQRDVEILAWLEQRSGVVATEFIARLFSSGSVLVSKTPAQAVEADCKEYTEDGRRFSVSQIEELGFDPFWERREAVTQALEAHRERHGYFVSVLMVTDVGCQASLLIVAGDERFRKAIAYPEREHGVFEMEGVVSRKKQLLPYLMTCLRAV